MLQNIFPGYRMAASGQEQGDVGKEQGDVGQEQGDVAAFPCQGEAFLEHLAACPDYRDHPKKLSESSIIFHIYGIFTHI